MWTFFFPFSPLHLENKHMKCEVWGSADTKCCVCMCVCECVCVGWGGGTAETVGWGRLGWSSWSGGAHWGKIENSCDLFFPLLFQSFSSPPWASYSSAGAQNFASTWLFRVATTSRKVIKGPWHSCKPEQYPPTHLPSAYGCECFLRTCFLG